MRKTPKKSNWARSESKLSSSEGNVIDNVKKQGNYIPPALNQGRPVKAVLKGTKKK